MAWQRKISKGLGRSSRSDSAVGAVTFIAGSAISVLLFFANPKLGQFEAYNLVNFAVLLWIPLSVILLLFRIDPSHFGVRAGDRKFGLKFTLIAILCMLPIVFAAAQFTEFRLQYGNKLETWLAIGGQACSAAYRHPILSPSGRPLGYPITSVHPLYLAYYELAMGCYMFCWEFFFRGFLLFGLARIRFLGNVGAIIVQTIPFTLLHWSLDPSASKPMMEIVSAFFGGLALGALAIRTKSFFYGFLIHWAIYILLTVFVIAPQFFHW